MGFTKQDQKLLQQYLKRSNHLPSFANSALIMSPISGVTFENSATALSRISLMAPDMLPANSLARYWREASEST